MTEFKIPYEFDKSLRYHLNDWKCRGHHESRHVKYEGPVMMEICLDPQCAKIVVTMCEHQITDKNAENPLAPTRSINTWNNDGTVLTCQYCGKDVT